ncbi:Hypothetical predicted protein [Lecanosticta acicola]|uniref:Uncharacterized protein n=1 Tax=Lecanosticta acicola TaxID=111012 RepID=A0AAI8Z225_9PEZI|nr:Hypothetical predicted protein [Lecanosticta acicola]
MDQETNSYVTNVFGYYSIPCNDFRTHLFHALQIFNTHGIPTCIFKHAEPASLSPVYDSRTRCAAILDGNHHNKHLCQAFDRFCYHVEDPGLEAADWQLRQELVRFARLLLCEAHRQEMTTPVLLGDLAEKVTVCRKRFILRERGGGGYASLSGRKEGRGGDHHHHHHHHQRQKSRFSSLFMTPRKSGEQQEFEQHGDRSASPSSGEEGSSNVRRSVSEKQTIRPMSSSPDMQGLQSPRHASIDLTFRDSRSKERHSVGRASALMTKLSPAQKSRWEVD